MPIISRFLGIVITMLWNDHAPPTFMRNMANSKSRSRSKPALLKENFHRARFVMCSNGVNCTR